MKKIIFIISTIFLLNYNVNADNNYNLTTIENAQTYSISKNWESFSYILTKDGKDIVIRDWKEIWEYYDDISYLKYFNNSKDLLYIWKNNWKKVLVKNWIEISWYSDNIYDLIISNDWNNYMYINKNNWKKSLIKDWKEIWSLYSDFFEVEFSDDWEWYFYQWQKNSKMEYIINWERIWAEYNPIYLFRYFPSWHYIFEWQKWGQDYTIYDWVIYKNIWTYSYTKDWNNFTYVKKVNWKETLVSNGVEWKIYDNIYLIFLSKNWESYSYAGYSSNWKWIFVKDWKEIWKIYDWFHSIYYLWDTTNVIYVWIENWKSVLIKNGVEIWKKYDKIDNITVSNDWKDYTYIWTNNNINVFVKNWIELPYWFNDINENNSINWDYVYSDNKKSYSYIWEENWKKFLMKDWVKIGIWYDYIFDIAYIPYSNDVVYLGINNQKRSIIKVTYDKVQLNQKESQTISIVWEKIIKMSNIKKNKYKNQLNQYLQKFEYWTKNYEIVKQLLEIIK